MKKFLLSFLCMICLLVPWQTMEAQGSQVKEDFENGTTLPTGWTTRGTASSTYQWDVYTGTSTKPAYEGTQCVRFDSYSASNGVTGILTSPSVTITSPEAKVSFAVKNPKGGFLAAYVSTDGGSTYFNNPLDTFENLTEWTVKAYNLGSYVGQSVCIVFHSVSNWVVAMLITIWIISNLASLQLALSRLMFPYLPLHKLLQICSGTLIPLVMLHLLIS